MRLGTSIPTLKVGSTAVAAIYLGESVVYPVPISVPGCIGWYDSADLTTMLQNSDGSGTVTAGDQVAYWADKSTTGAHLNQPTGANRPTLTAGAVNGRTALVFDGNNDNLFTSGYTSQSGLSGLTRIAVYSTTQNSMLTKASGSADACFFVANNDFVCRVSSAAGNAVAASTPAQVALGVYAHVFDGSAGTSETFFNDSLQADISSPYITGPLPATTPSGSATLHVGSNAAANNFIAGPIAEYIIYNRALSSAERTLLYSYLSAKWGV